jgi:dTMP kinase
MKKWMDAYSDAAARLEEINKFFRWNHEANKMHLDYLQEQRREEARKAAEQKAREREERERQTQEQEKAQELERQREEENRRARELERNRRGMGMGR